MEAFLQERIPFPGIPELTSRVLQADWSSEPRDFREVVETGKRASARAALEVARL